MLTAMKVGFISGTGPQGKGIALRWAKAGREIYIGSRTLEKAQTVCNEINAILGDVKAVPLTNEDMLSHCQIILLTVPYEHALETCKTYSSLIRNNTKIFIDVTIPMEWQKGKGMVPLLIPNGSGAELIQKILNDVPVVAAFMTQSAEALLEINKPIDQDNFICGPKEVRQQVIELTKEIGQGLRPIDAGSLWQASIIEKLVPFLININRRYNVKDAGLKIIM